jgi:hypothetical protein
LRGVWHALKQIRTSDESLHFFLERWALQVAHYRGKRDMTETHAAMPAIASISPFQVHGIHLDISLQYFPGPWVPAPSSGIYRSRNSAPECQLSAGFLSMMTGPNRPKKTALSSVRCALKYTPTSAQSHRSFLEQLSLQVGHYCGNFNFRREAGHDRTPSCNTTYR